MNLPSLQNRLSFTRCKSEFVITLFREFLNDLPFSFYFKGRISHPSPLPLKISGLFWFTSVIGSSNLSLPLLLLLCLLRASEVSLEISFVFLLLNLQLLSLSLSLLGCIDSLFILLRLTLIFDARESKVFGVFNKLWVCVGLNLLLRSTRIISAIDRVLLG